MNKKEFDQHIIDQGGLVVSEKLFHYNGATYDKYIFLRDSKQKDDFLSIRLRIEYLICWIKFGEKQIIKNNHSKSYWTLCKARLFFLLLFTIKEIVVFFFILLMIILPFILPFVILRKSRNRYAKVPERLGEIKQFEKAYVLDTTNEYKICEVEQRDWAFLQIMLQDWSKRKHKKHVFSIENYLDYKNFKEKSKK